MLIQQGAHAGGSALDTVDGPYVRAAFLEQQRVLAESVQHLTHVLDSLIGIRRTPLADDTTADSRVATPRLAVCCFGPFELLLNGAPAAHWRSSKARSLFLYLVSHRGRPATRESLVEALWPDNATAPATDALKVVVHRLRRALSAADSGLEVVSADDGYMLAECDMWVDVEEFERLCALARRQEHAGQAAAIDTFSSAVELYRGDFLEDVTDEWVFLRRERLRDQYLLALSRLADAAFATGDFQGCIESCQQILAHDSCREEAYRFLMLAYACLGQRGRVRRWYEVCCAQLRTELDIAPEPETERTYRRAIVGELTQSIASVDTRR